MEQSDLIKRLLKPRQNFIKTWLANKQTFEKYQKGIVQNTHIIDYLYNHYDIYRKEYFLQLISRKIPHQKILLRPYTSDIEVLVQIFYKDHYKATKNAVASIKNEADNLLIVDAGANIGLTDIYFHTHFPNANIIAIEPDQGNLKLLRKNLHQNISEEIYQIFPAALWHKSGQTIALSNDFRDGESWARSVTENISNYTKADLARTITLANIIEKADGRNIDLLKIDIEGSEKILFDDDDFLKILSEKVHLLAIELHEEIQPKEAYFKKLTELNFEVIDNDETVVCLNRKIN